MTEPFLLSTRALSLLRRGRDLVNSSMCEGLQPGGDFVVDELRTVVGVESADVEGERPEQGFEDGGETGRVDALDRADELELGDLVDEVEVVEALDAVEVSLVDRIDPQVRRAGAGAARRWRCARGGSARASSRGGVDSWSSGAGCRGVRWRWRRGARSGGRRTAARPGGRACGWPDRRGCRGGHRLQRAARCRPWCSGVGRGAGGGGGRRWLLWSGAGAAGA